ncbi:MAG: cytochrome c oxidase assembly protein [Nocardioidaceae bacterium]
MSDTGAPPVAAAVSSERAVGTGVVARWAGGTFLITVSVLVLALVLGHGAHGEVPEGLPDPGPVTNWGLPILRTLTDLAGVLTVGLLLTAVLLLPSTDGQLRGLCFRAVRAAGRVALVWSVIPLGSYLLTVSDIFAVPVANALSASLLRGLFDISVGPALLAQSGLAAGVAVLSRWTLTVREGSLLLGLALAALLPPALTGHSAAAGSHSLAVVSLLVHVVAVSLWVGGLVGLAWIAVIGSGRLPYGVVRFSVLALWSIAVVAISGAVNAAVRLGSLADLVSTRYGALVLVKASAIVGLGLLGWMHRRRTMPVFTDRVRSADDGDADRVARRAFASLAGVELTVMAMTVAVAVALSRTPPPVPDDALTSEVATLTGISMPPAPSVSQLLGGYYPDGVGLVLVLFGAALYAAGMATLRRRGDSWPRSRTVSWFTGLAVVAWSTFGGLGLYSHVLFSAHMVSHMLLAMVAPIFLVLAAPMTLALRALPGPRVPGEVSPRTLLTTLLHSRLSRLLTHPIVAAGLFIASLYGLYFTGLFGALMRSHLGHAAMEVHFLAVGCLLFYVLVGVDPGPRRIPPLVRFGLLLVVLPLHAFFSITVMSAETVLAGSYWTSLNRPFSTDLVADQHLGGSISWALGELPLLIVLAALFAQWFRSDSREAGRLDRAHARRPGSAVRPDALDSYNAYLARLHAGDQAPGDRPADDPKRPPASHS